MITVNEIRIPTLAGLGLLLVGLVGGVILVNQSQIFKSQASATSEPKSVILANISSSSASILWQTDEPTTGFVRYGQLPTGLDQVANDERDSTSPQKHSLHLVTLNNLRPDTTYYYQINSGGNFTSQAVSFKTAAAVSSSNYQALLGAVIDENLQPIDEALIVLEIPGAQRLAAVSKVAGNFNLPLSEIRTEDLTSPFQLEVPGLEADLRIFNNSKQSHVTLELPIFNFQLPALILGQDRRLESIAPPTPTPNPLGRYDLNQDNKLDDLDRDIIRKNFFKVPADPLEADINQDGVVNQQDLTTFNVFARTSGQVSPTPTPR